MNHTPGPWQVPDDNHVGVYGGDEQTLIATVARTPDRIANARLIAAAPELLAALKLALPIIEADAQYWRDTTPRGGTANRLDEFAAGIREVIAKAEGK